MDVAGLFNNLPSNLSTFWVQPWSLWQLQMNRTEQNAKEVQTEWTEQQDKETERG